MISGGPPANKPKHKGNLVTREVNIIMSQSKATPTYLKWSETAITFDRTDHSNHI